MSRRLATRALAVSFVFGISLPLACSSSDEGSGGNAVNGVDASSTGSTNAGGASGASGATGSSGTGAGGLGAIPDGGALAGDLCGGDGCACSNGVDDDGDGKVDGFDEECTGPLDNDEGSFATGIPGDNIDPKWQDCFFDGNSGAGDDGCRYHTDCLTGDKTADDPGCSVAMDCRDFCAARTPNGCDCFGCCSVVTGSGTVDIQIGIGCSLENVSDEAACPPCVKTTQCGNECGECELCPGRSVEDLPASCAPPVPDGGVPEGAPPPPGYTCDDGEQVCTELLDCPASYYCSLGCCLPSIR
jgi:hypothetical protein